MPTWLRYLTRFAVGLGATLISFVVLVLLATLAVYLAYGTLDTDYNSSPPSIIIVFFFSPLLLLMSIILGGVVGYRLKLPKSPLMIENQNEPLLKST